MTGAVVFQCESTKVHLFCIFYFCGSDPVKNDGGRHRDVEAFVSHFSYFVSDPLDPKMN